MANEADKYVSDIAGLAAWGDLPGDLREKIAHVLLSIGAPRKAAAGDTWIREGEHTENKGYVLLRGTVAIIREEHPKAQCEAPALLGEMMQFNPQEHRLATVTALTRCTVLRFSWDDFWKAAETQFDDVERATIKKLVEQYAWERFMNWD